MSDSDPEIDFLRAVEDLFSTLRGVPHTLSPKDIHLARGFWKDGIRLAAISAGVSEVIDRKRTAGDIEPVVSVSYCRHAIRRHAKRLADQSVGSRADEAEASHAGARASVDSLISQLRTTAATHENRRAPVSTKIRDIAQELDNALNLDASEIESFVFGLETALIEGCWMALQDKEKQLIKETAMRSAVASGATGEAQVRAFRAFRDRELRTLLNLPRLEID